MSIIRRQLIDYIQEGVIPREKVEAAKAVMSIPPSGKSWSVFLDKLLLWIGGLAIAFAVVFFMAYNWDNMGYFIKFAIAEGCIILSILSYYFLGDNKITGKVSILLAAIFLGVLLALYGQTYQTGADSWQLFFNWALLMLPWALIGRFPGIWILWVGLMNLSIALYFITFGGVLGVFFGGEYSLFWLIFIFNTLVFIIWQLLAVRFDFLSESWAIRLLGVGSGVPITWLAILSIFENYQVGDYPIPAWLVFIIVMIYIYRKIKIDLFILAGCCLSIITVSVSFIGNEMLPNGDAEAFLFLAIMVTIMGGGSAMWLRSISQEDLS